MSVGTATAEARGQRPAPIALAVLREHRSGMDGADGPVLAKFTRARAPLCGSRTHTITWTRCRVQPCMREEQLTIAKTNHQGLER